MNLATIDWSIIVGYLVLSLGIGLFFAKRAGSNLVEYFVAGRKLTWWVAGTSIVATSFAADTPLAIARIVRTNGLQGNWYWWSGVMGFVLCMFFFARLWRRAKVLTDVELLELRYEGKPAAILRLFHALYRSILQNGLVMGTVILGMQKISVVLGIQQSAGQILGYFGVAGVEQYEKAILVGGLVLLCLIYTMLSGLWGVVITDLFQFILAMVGSIILTTFVLQYMGGPKGLAEKVVAAAASAPKSAAKELAEQVIATTGGASGSTEIAAKELTEQAISTAASAPDSVKIALKGLAEQVISTAVNAPDSIKVVAKKLADQVIVTYASSSDSTEMKAKVLAEEFIGTLKIASPDQILDFVPDFSAGGWAIFAFIIFIGVQWWGGGRRRGISGATPFCNEKRKACRAGAALVYLCTLCCAHLAMDRRRTRFDCRFSKSCRSGNSISQNDGRISADRS